MPETTIRVDDVMGDIERDVRSRLRRHLIKRGGAADYHDEEIFETVRAVLARAVDERNLDATLLPELLDADVDWRMQTHLALSSHRPVAGKFILFFKQRVLVPLTRGCSGTARTISAARITSTACCSRASRLALENARLRRDVAARLPKP